MVPRTLKTMQRASKAAVDAIDKSLALARKVSTFAARPCQRKRWLAPHRTFHDDAFGQPLVVADLA